MGVRLEIGRVAQLAELAQESQVADALQAAERARREVELAADELALRGFGSHVEPELPAEGLESPSLSLWNDTALHYLRRIAVHLWAEGRVPAPGSFESLDDPLYEEYYDAREEEALGAFWKRARETQELTLDFPHLCVHADDSGWYLPIEFPEPVLVKPMGKGCWVGSSVGLLAECGELAEALELDLGRDPGSSEVLEAVRRSEAGDKPQRPSPGSSGGGDQRWRRYGIETHTCLILARAASAALETGTALCLVREEAGRNERRPRSDRDRDRGAGRGRR